MFGTIKKHLNGKMPFSNILRFNKLNSSIPEPPWEYDFLLNLPQIEYPKYLAKAYKYRTNEDLPLSFDIKNGSFVIDKAKCKTYNQKMQWLKLYDATPLKKLCTDKVTARNYVQEKIGAQYLKPVLQICNSFDEINFDTLPDCFIMKCSHGCKWQFSIRNKNDFLSSKRTFFDVKQQM